MTRTLSVGVLAVLAVGPACRQAPAPTPDVVAVMAPRVPDTPADAAWDAAPEHVATLLLQDLVEPRLMTPSTPQVRVRAIAAPNEVAFRLEWADASLDDLPGNGRFVDGCAVQVPATADPNTPDPQMGQVSTAGVPLGAAAPGARLGSTGAVMGRSPGRGPSPGRSA